MATMSLLGSAPTIIGHRTKEAHVEFCSLSGGFRFSVRLRYCPQPLLGPNPPWAVLPHPVPSPTRKNLVPGK